MNVLSVFLACRYLSRRKIVLLSVAAVALSALILHESVGVGEIVGILLILAGVWIVDRQVRDRPPSSD